MTEKIVIGKIVNTHGIKGEVKIFPYTDYKERFEEITYIYIEDNEEIQLKIERVRYKSSLVIIKFKGIDNINDIEKFKNKNLFIKRDQLRNLGEDEFYIFDLIGSKAYDQNDRYIGKLIDIIQNPAQDIYVIELDNKPKKAMIPAVKEFIKNVDIKNKIINISLIEGMIE